MEVDERVLFFFQASSLLLYTGKVSNLFHSGFVKSLGSGLVLGVMFNGSILNVGSGFG